MHFPKIRRFRHARKCMKGLNVVCARGTVKIHGTNAGLFMRYGVVHAMSRNRVLSPGDNDNHGFAAYVKEYQDSLRQLFTDLPNGGRVEYYGEWCGPGIQSGVAVNELPHRILVLFAMRYPYMDSNKLLWANTQAVQVPADARVYTVEQFRPPWMLPIDLARPEDAAAKMERLTAQVEERCPVGAYFGIDGIGEGIVWKACRRNPNLWWKTKGEKHRGKPRKRVKVRVDPQVAKDIDEFVEATVTEARCMQAIAEIDGEHVPESTGEYLEWVHQDILAEEGDMLAASGLTWKQVAGKVTAEAKRHWFDTIP